MLTQAVFTMLIAASDTTRASAPLDTSRVVRELAPVEVRARLTHPRSSQTVHEIGARVIRTMPVDRFADVLALQPGVVVIGDELYVRGGRPGENVVVLEGLPLNEPQRGRPTELPLLAVQRVDVVSGMPEPRHPAALAGVLDLHTFDPTARLEGEARWQTDGGFETYFDRWSGRITAPLALGLGVAAAADLYLDDTWLPRLRSEERKRWAGLDFKARAENQLSGWIKLAPVASPRRCAAQAFASRRLRRPFDPMWSLDGWFGIDGGGVPDYSPDSLPGYVRYRAADHLATTEERRVGGVITAGRTGARGSVGMSLGGVRAYTLTATAGELGAPISPPVFGAESSEDPFHVLFGDDGLRRESQSERWQLRVDAERAVDANALVRTGAGVTYEDAWLDEVDIPMLAEPVDAIRRYHAFAAGGFGYAQGRWEREGLLINPGLRLEYWTAGAARDHQTLPAGRRGHLLLSPRAGIAYPLSPRDVFSMAWARTHQPPARDFLYDQRTIISNRQPLGNPALSPAVQSSWESAIKHLLTREWSLQAGAFYRDVTGQVGARNGGAGGFYNVRYTDLDQASAVGFEGRITYEGANSSRCEMSYTFLRAWGYESRPEGDPYGQLRGLEPEPIAETPLSWDRQHTCLATAYVPMGRHVVLAWSTALGSPLPWTAKPQRAPPVDLVALNGRRLGWTETTNLDVRVTLPPLPRLTVGLEVRNLFDHRGEIGVTVDGYPNPLVNTDYDDYGAYRTETGLGGGAYWLESTGQWVPVHDPRLVATPRRVRVSAAATW